MTKIRLVLFFAFSLCLISNFTIAAKECPKKMKAVGYYKSLPIFSEDSLLDFEVDVPSIRDNEVLLEVKAISVNPVEVIIRTTYPPVNGEARILGSDGSGVIIKKGKNVKRWRVGDEVFFVEDLRRNGSNAQYVAVEDYLVAPKPKNLTFEEAAAMPLTSITAYETIYDRFLISEKDRGKTFLIINSGGGVGSVAIQLAKNFGLTVIGTASRPETEAFCRQNGADIVLNHRKDLKTQLEIYGYKNGVDYILVNYDPYPYWDTLMKIIKAQGKICLIVPSTGLVDVKPMLEKSVTLVSEMQLTKIIYDTEDKYREQNMLEDISKMLDSGKLKTTLTKILSPINAANLKIAHSLLENHIMVGKVVLTGFLNNYDYQTH